MKQYKTYKSKFILAAKGLAMGAADIIPGVSGGTVALISGIYEHLISAISRIHHSHLKSLFLVIFSKGKEKREKNISHIKTVPFNFFLPLLTGVLTGMVLMAGLIKKILKDYPFETYAYFFGLIFFSLTIPYKKMHHHAKEIVVLLVFAVLLFFLTGHDATLETAHHPAYLFFCGAVAICAMILPGISGAFILLLLGEYDYMLSALKSADVMVVLPFILGILTGIFSFVRVLKYFLSRHHSLTMAALTGIMAGSLRKLWPFSHTTQSVSDTWLWALLFFLAGVFTLAMLEKISVWLDDPEPPV
ncbi:MAG: DUF368 domain-containing protein [Spirochaetia bacterium]|nr:DUF368 domain-containing protein [Spirochaetia bacterium]